MVALLVASGAARAASTGTTALAMPQTSGSGTANGDYITATVAGGGLHTLYHFFIEVSPGLGRLRVQLFDADFGAGGAAEAAAQRDRSRTAFGNVTYTLLRPDGTTAATLTCNAGVGTGLCADNAWSSLLDSTTAQNTAAGHWELRVDQTSVFDDGVSAINAFGLRADDGDATSGGTELPVYYDSHDQIGQNPPATGSGTKTYTLYPYITSGCSASENDFDYDSNNGAVGSIGLSSRSGAFTFNIPSASLSVNNTWTRNTFSGWTSDQSSTDDGIWTATAAISNYTVAGVVNGNYANVWFASSAAAANPPTANPTANAFRVYLPTDAGTAPVKPYMEQLLTFKSGTNPVPVGQTGRYQVTIRVVNPTAQSITFSAAHLVTANVPGAGATYAGNAAVTQGTVTAQPAVGGTGNVTWNPGTLAAGSTALLTYQVNVTPTAAGQRIPVTGTVASGNGTRGQWVDETGNTTQARATFLFGPLCELAATQGVLTEAVVSSFRADADSGAVALEWETASEAGTAGYYVERWDAAAGRYARVSDRFLPAVVQAVQGGRYRFVDPTASPRESTLRYRLIEVRADGARRRLGPFDVQVEWERERSAGLPRDGFDAVAHRGGRRSAAATAAARGMTAPLAAGGSAQGLRLGVRETGLYFVSSATLAAALGDSQNRIERALANGKLRLTKQGQPVWWLPAPPTAAKQSPGMYFYGEAIHDLYSAEEVYHLERGNGPTMPTLAVGAGAGAAGASFPAVSHVETDAFPATSLALDPESDYWFWQFLIGGDAANGTRTLPFDAPGLAVGGSASLRVRLQGATASGVAGEHVATVSLNGTPLGQTQWSGVSGDDATFAVPGGVLQASGNQLQIVAAVGAGAPYSIQYLDFFEVSYPRLFVATGDALAFSPGGTGGVTIGGLTSPDVKLLDVSDGLHPRLLGGATIDPTLGVSFQPPSPSGSYLAVGPAGVKTPSVAPWVTAGLRQAGTGADYLIVTTADMASAAQRLADYRQGQGLLSRVVDVAAVMNEFGDGRSSPHALRDFLGYAATRWNPAPRYVLLAGAGSLDFRNLLGYGDSRVPTLIVATANGLFGSDNRLADLAGDDGVPEVAIGRAPVMSAAELDGYVDKVIAYEAASGAWTSSLLALADAQSQAADFAADSEAVLGVVRPGYTPQRVYLDAVPFAAARDLVLGGLRAGAAFVDYLGHGGLDRLSAGGLLASADVPGLGNGSKLPVVTAMTCTVNRFTVPGIPALGELLVDEPDGGAIAVWSPSALSLHGEARALAQQLYAAVSAGAPARLGDLVKVALERFHAGGGSPTMPGIYVLLGDPALLWKAAPPPSPSGSPGSGGE